MYYKPEILKVLKYKQNFWDAQYVDLEIYLNSKKLYEYFKLIQNCTLIIGLIIIAIYSFRPLFKENSQFIFDCWCVSDSIVLEAIVLFCQYYFLALAVSIVLGYDSMYYCFCVHLIVQLRILRFKLKNMSKDTKENEIYTCIKHHQLLLL